VSHTSRRHFLKGVGAVGVAGSLAGCAFGVDALESSMSAVDVEGLTMFKGAPAHGEYPAEPSHIEHEMPGGTMEMDAVTVSMIAATDDSNNYHFMPHVAWVEPGQTVFWEHFSRDGVSERRTHTVTSFGNASLFPRLIPEGSHHFDSGFRAGTHGIDQDELIDERHNREMVDQIGQEGGFSHTFEEEGVYLYYCQNHHEFKMAAAIVVGELWGEGGSETVDDPDGWAPGMTTDLHELEEADEMHGEAVHQQVEELREMIHSGGEMMGGDH
jgi:plastocyanin